MLSREIPPAYLTLLIMEDSVYFYIVPNQNSKPNLMPLNDQYVMLRERIQAKTGVQTPFSLLVFMEKVCELKGIPS